MKNFLRRVKHPIKIIKTIIRKWKDVTFRPYVKRKNVEGVEFDFYVGNIEGREWYDIYATDPKWDEMRHIKDLLIEEGDVVFELGSHHGCTATVLANWVGPEGKVIAFEPSPINAAIFKKNIELNKLNNVELKQQAAGERTGHGKFKGISILPENTKRSFHEIEMVCVDDLIELNPTLLKLDVQGYEVKALKGAQKILQTCPKLAIEIHCNEIIKYGDTIEDMLSLLDIDKYESWILYNDEVEVHPFIGDIEKMKNYDFAHLFAVAKRQKRS